VRVIRVWDQFMRKVPENVRPGRARMTLVIYYLIVKVFML
jgi:hypothetical protein